MISLRTLFVGSLLFCSTLYGLSLDELTQKALSANPSLKTIQNRILVNKSDIDLSNQFANPVLSYSQDTLSSSEKMHKQTLAISQKLPYYGKRDSKKGVTLAQESVLKLTLQEARVSLTRAIRDEAYKVWELEELYKTIDEYVELTKQNIELFESYTATASAKNQHMGIMSAELTLTDLQIQKSTLDAKIASSYAKLSYLSAFKVDKLEINLKIENLQDMQTLKKELKNNKTIARKNSIVLKQQAVVDSTKIDNYPDFNLVASYSRRPNYDDYMTFGLGITLPIYSTEDYKEQKARKAILVAKSIKDDSEILIDSEFRVAYAQMKSAFEIYHVIQDEALPKLEHMFELTSSSIATGGDLFKYIDILVKKLKLEQKSIVAVSLYNRNRAKISQLSGELQ